MRRARALVSTLTGWVLLSSGCQHGLSHDRGKGAGGSSSVVVEAPRAATPPAPVMAASAEPASRSASVSAPKPRVYAKNRYVFVRPRPDVNADWIGFLWFGASVELASAQPVRGPGCASYYAIEPRGYVCVDEKQATLTAADPVFEAVSRYAPKLEQASPHAYGESLGVELRSVPPAGERAFPNLPALFHEPRRKLSPFSTVAYNEDPDALGHEWLLSADLLWIQKRQVKPYPPAMFHGVELGGESQLPLAFFRRAGSAKFRQNAQGRLEKSADSFALQSWLALGAESVTQSGERYLKALNGNDWVRERDAVVPKPRSVTPWGARVGSEDHTGRAPQNARKTWIEVSVLGGWLLAYEGTRPVYVTLVSPGRGGIALPGTDPLAIDATPAGTFPISGKLATVTMEAPGESVHSDVPWTQNFKKPYAIHSAYWHDNWGNLQSGGCINVSPIDGKWLFDFSEPALPAGWHAVRWQPALGAPTVLVVHE